MTSFPAVPVLCGWVWGPGRSILWRQLEPRGLVLKYALEPAPQCIQWTWTPRPGMLKQLWASLPVRCQTIQVSKHLDGGLLGFYWKCNLQPYETISAYWGVDPHHLPVTWSNAQSRNVLRWHWQNMQHEHVVVVVGGGGVEKYVHHEVDASIQYFPTHTHSHTFQHGSQWPFSVCLATSILTEHRRVDANFNSPSTSLNHQIETTH